MSTFDNSNGVARVVMTQNDRSNYTAANEAHAAEAGRDRFQSSSMVVGDALSISGRADTSTPGSFRAYSAAHEPGLGVDGDVLATARTSTGAMLTRELRDTDTIDVGGMRTSVKSAIAAGLVSRDILNGRSTASAQQRTSPTPVALGDTEASRELAQMNQQRTDEATTADEADVLPDLPAAEHGIVEHFNKSVDNVLHTQITRSLINEGTLSEDMARAAADQLGITPAQVMEQSAQVYASYEAQAVEALGSSNGPSILAWARQNAPAMLKTAIEEHVHTANASSYANVERQFWISAARNTPDMIINASNAAELNPRMVNRTLMVTLPGAGTMSFVAAINAGFIAAPKKAPQARKGGGR
jgi:hypothetical protein